MSTRGAPLERDTRVDPYVDDHAAFLGECNGTAPAGLTALRLSGISGLSERGFPTTRDEEWRFTNLAPLLRRTFRRGSRPLAVGTADATGHRVLPDASHLVFVDGRHAPELSWVGALPPGVRISSLAGALADPDEDVLAHLGRHAPADGNPFVALNTAFLGDGAYIRVGRGVTLEQPIEILHLATGADADAAWVSYPRALVVLEESAGATVIETFAAARPGAHLTCAVTEVVVGANAALDHYKLQQEDHAAHHMAAMHFTQGRDSVVRSHNFTVGAALSRTDVNAVLAGDGVECTLNGLYVVGGDQHVDTHMRVEHARPHGGSHEVYKGVLDDRATGVFNGRIYVHQEAQKTDAKQSNRNLLLSQEALVNSNPQLEIFADDVKCTHGSTVGQLDQEAMFYLRSRGIDEAAARSLLIHAFVGDILEGIRVAPLRTRLEATLRERLPGGDIVSELA